MQSIHVLKKICISERGGAFLVLFQPNRISFLFLVRCYILSEEKVIVLGPEPVVQSLPSAGFKSENNLVHRHRI